MAVRLDHFRNIVGVGWGGLYVAISIHGQPAVDSPLVSGSGAVTPIDLEATFETGEGGIGGPFFAEKLDLLATILSDFFPDSTEEETVTFHYSISAEGSLMDEAQFWPTVEFHYSVWKTIEEFNNSDPPLHEFSDEGSPSLSGSLTINKSTGAPQI